MENKNIIIGMTCENAKDYAYRMATLELEHFNNTAKMTTNNSFYNTISFSGDDLKKENAKAAKQEELILSLFKANPDKKLSPSQVHSIVGRKYQIYPPITSIRRALTNLTGRLELIKTDEMVPGVYHLPEHTWKLAGTSENIYKNGTQSAGDIAGKIIKVTQSELF